MSNNGIVRVHYFERQFLRTQDFSDEQAYHLAMRRRHNIAHHSWGIVHGLKITVEEGNIFVQPGVAIDGYGRELILPQKQPIPTGAFDDKDSDVLDVWLLYQRLGTDPAPNGYAGCVAEEDDADEKVPFYRWQEHARIRLDVPDPAFPDRRQPESVPEGDLEFDASRTPPDDPQDDWPVFLGQVQRVWLDPSQPPTYSRNMDDRPYAGLIGEAVAAPSGRALLQIGAERADDSRRFAVFVPAPDPKDKHPQPWLEIDAAGEVDIRGRTMLHGDLQLESGVAEFGVGETRSRRTSPWRIYRHVQRDCENAGPSSEGQPEMIAHQLRIEMDAGRGRQGQKGYNQVVIGSWSADDGAFQPCLTVRDDCRVIVSGNLVVRGRIIETAIRPLASFSEEARGFGQAAMLTGIGGASSLLDNLYRSPYEGDEDVVIRLLDSADGRAVVAEVLLEDESRCEALMILVVADPLGQRAILAGLQPDSDRFEEFVGLIMDDGPGRQAIVDSLEASSTRREAVANKLMDKESIQQALSRSLLAIHDGQRAIVDNLGPSQLDTFVVLLLDEDEVRQAIAVRLLETPEGQVAAAGELLAEPEGRAVIIAILRDHEEHRTAFSVELAGNLTTRNAVVDSLLENPTGRDAIIINLQEHEERRTAFSNTLEKNETTRNAFIDSLLGALQNSLDDPESTRIRDFADMVKGKSEDLATALRNALNP